MINLSYLEYNRIGAKRCPEKFFLMDETESKRLERFAPAFLLFLLYTLYLTIPQPSLYCL